MTILFLYNILLSGLILGGGALIFWQLKQITAEKVAVSDNCHALFEYIRHIIKEIEKRQVKVVGIIVF